MIGHLAQKIGFDALSEVRERGIGRGELAHGDFGDTERKGGDPRELFGESEVAGGIGYAWQTALLREANGRHVQRLLERLAKGYAAAIALVVVVRLPPLVGLHLDAHGRIE